MTSEISQERVENLGPAERIINTLLQHVSHLWHGRPGFVKSASNPVGIEWFPVTHKVDENGVKNVYRLDQVGKKTKRTQIGVLRDDGKIVSGGRVVGEYRSPGIVPEVAKYLYSQIAEVWKMDNEFAAKWASYAFGQDHRDLKVILAAFMLVQSRKGDPVREDNQILFYDDDHRNVGEAMCLIHNKKLGGLSPKQLIRVFEVLSLPEIAQINRELGFGKSERNPALGRLPKAVQKWLAYRELNQPLLDGLVNAGYRQTVMKLCQKVGYKPGTPDFFQKLRWKQKQSQLGHRTIAIGQAVSEAESWEGLSERDICEKIVSGKMKYKKIIGLLPPAVGLTRAVLTATVEANGLSDQDMIILTPTLEDLGLLEVQSVKARWDQAVLKAENQRAANIAKRVKKQEVIEGLQQAADNAAKKAVEEEMKDLRVYVIVDKSGSMQGAIERAKSHLSKFLQAFPLDKLHVSTFNTHGKVINIRHASAAGVEQAFRGENAGGGTCYATGVDALASFQPSPHEDVLFIFIGDEEDGGVVRLVNSINRSGLRPNAFGLIKVESGFGWGNGSIVTRAAAQLGIPCFNVEENIFSDPYAVTRTLQNLIKSTPVGQKPAGVARTRVSLIETILKQDLLRKPVWAEASLTV